jgi:hypothetical protein
MRGKANSEPSQFFFMPKKKESIRLTWVFLQADFKKGKPTHYFAPNMISHASKAKGQSDLENWHHRRHR